MRRVPKFLFEDSLGTISHSFIIRPINERLKIKQTIMTLTTPYGYGIPNIGNVMVKIVQN